MTAKTIINSIGAIQEGFSAIDVNVCFGDVKTPTMRPMGLTGADASGAGIEVVAINFLPPQSERTKSCCLLTPNTPRIEVNFSGNG
jgi:hypothetical protein